ncbi:AEC family transporter [Undibacterium oligocarboniphilum]|uniref:AEC family transporter n=1 Tax=Undibacterium oligocarboniphilum TaxID=666702 RepID=A0A850QIU0_9BURK|nr:AEC family transporter [Undibacterium oligocarboniphilum]MBC3871602.1 AEC family transporter [Undibacterium oligocarboniphilum]NVO79039.1 AEC family transporter [Undibacterium oligocarboniphilum]
MSVFTLLFPDFSLILIGFLLARISHWGGHFWAGVEKIVYFIMFPALLFYTTSRTQFDFHATGHLLQVGVIATAAGMLLGWLARFLFRSPPRIFESGVQTAFRFNSYIALAIASRLAGEQGTALMALLIGFLVPLCNMAAVYALAHNSGRLLKEIASNPLVIGTASGVACSLLQWHLPEGVNATLSRLGNASIALGLLAVGAGMRLSAIHEAKGIAAYFLSVKLLALPLIALLLGRWLALPLLQLQIVVVFCALPTASSAYVLAARMGGNGPFVAFLISASTILSVLTLPVWLHLVS